MSLTDIPVVENEFFVTGLQIVALACLQNNTNMQPPAGSEKLHICICPMDNGYPAVGYAYSDDAKEGQELARHMAKHMASQTSLLTNVSMSPRRRKQR